MKNLYQTPEIEVIKFTLSVTAALNVSQSDYGENNFGSNVEEGPGNEGDPWD